MARQSSSKPSQPGATWKTNWDFFSPPQQKTPKKYYTIPMLWSVNTWRKPESWRKPYLLKKEKKASSGKKPRVLLNASAININYQWTLRRHQEFWGIWRRLTRIVEARNCLNYLLDELPYF
jgi:hypothetical protein